MVAHLEVVLQVAYLVEVQEVDYPLQEVLQAVVVMSVQIVTMTSLHMVLSAVIQHGMSMA